MTGIIPEEEEEQELYDDVGQMDEIYEVLPGLIRIYTPIGLEDTLFISFKLENRPLSFHTDHSMSSLNSPEEDMPNPPPKVEPVGKHSPPAAAGKH